MAQVEGTGTVSSDPAKWWVVALLGVISIAAGVLALAYPDITLLVLGLIVGINLVLIGVVWVTLATMEQHRGRPRPPLHRRLPRDPGWSGLPGPSRAPGVLTLLIALSFWFILTGVADLARATR